MRAEEEDRQPHVLEESDRGGRVVVGSTVEQYGAVCPLAWALFVQIHCEVLEVDLHCLVVGVSLRQA